MTLEIQILAWDRHKNVARLNQLYVYLVIYLLANEMLNEKDKYLPQDNLKYMYFTFYMRDILKVTYRLLPSTLFIQISHYISSFKS
jgi:hypothetical protein